MEHFKWLSGTSGFVGFLQFLVEYVSMFYCLSKVVRILAQANIMASIWIHNSRILKMPYVGSVSIYGYRDICHIVSFYLKGLYVIITDICGDMRSDFFVITLEKHGY